VTAQIFDIGNDPAGALKISVAAPVAKVTGKLLDAAGQPGSFCVVRGRYSFIRRRGERRWHVHREVYGSGEHRAYLLSPTDVWDDVIHNPDFRPAHQSVFPTVQSAEGANPPLILRLPAQ
jgi:hypothetical protein